MNTSQTSASQSKISSKSVEKIRPWQSLVQVTERTTWNDDRQNDKDNSFYRIPHFKQAGTDEPQKPVPRPKPIASSLGSG